MLFSIKCVGGVGIEFIVILHVEMFSCRTVLSFCIKKFMLLNRIQIANPFESFLNGKVILAFSFSLLTIIFLLLSMNCFAI